MASKILITATCGKCGLIIDKVDHGTVVGYRLEDALNLEHKCAKP